MENKPQTFREITPDQIRDWKAKFGEYALEEIAIPLNQYGDEEITEEDIVFARFVVCTPNRNVILAATKHSANIEKANQILIENCVLGGDMQTIEQYGAVYTKIIEWAEKRISTYVNFRSKKL
ncbi:MAG: hypothetical protein LC105_06150 [Chitinophagales bacterium]|nr:hypothetical protein [Chitinophagales bacterium]